METQTRDIQFESFVVDLAETLDLGDMRFGFGVVESVVGGLVALYEAFAQPEPGVVAAAARGLVI